MLCELEKKAIKKNRAIKIIVINLKISNQFKAGKITSNLVNVLKNIVLNIFYLINIFTFITLQNTLRTVRRKPIQ